jgi:zinc protease
MKQHKFLFTLLLALGFLSAAQAQEEFRKKAPAALPAPVIKLGNYVQQNLPNGLKVIVVENHKLPQVSFQVFIDKPISLEKDLAGVGDITGTLMRSGTKTKNKAQLDEEIDFIGATLFTSSDGMFASSLTKHKDKVLSMMADVLFNPAFNKDEFDKIKKQTLSGLASDKDDPNSIASKVADVINYGAAHPYGELTNEASVNKITVADCESYYKTYFKPNVTYLVVVGDITPAQAFADAAKYFGKWIKGTVAKQTFAAPSAPEKTRVAFVNRDGAVQSVIRITYPLSLKPNDADAIKAAVMNNLLGADGNSRLYQNLREDKGYTYGIYSGLQTDMEIGEFNAGGSVRNAVTDSSIVEMLKEIRKMANETPMQAEVDRTKAIMAGAYARRLENPQNIANYALNIARYGLPKDYYGTYLAKLAAVTPADLQAVAKKYLKPENANIVVVGSKDDVSEKLKAFGQVLYFDANGNPEKAAAAISADVTPESIIEKFIAAEGGRAKLSAVKDMETQMVAEIQGISIEIASKKKAPNKFMQSVTAMGSVMSLQAYDGSKGKIEQQGQNVPIGEKELAKLALEGPIFPELDYTKAGYKLSLKGEEAVNGAAAYKIVVEDPTGEKTTNFYDKTSGLLLKSIKVIEGGGQTITQVSEYKDYKEVNGIQLPHTILSTGATPFPLELKAKKVAINAGIDDSAFKVE